MPLTSQQQERYNRTMLLEGIGPDGQDKLLHSRVLIVGAGGLGSSAAFYLAAAGVGTLGIVDSDRVELSNLQRQILHSTADLGRPKVESAGRKLRSLNPDVHIEKHSARLTPGTIAACIDEYEFVVDATDNFESKFMINDACVRRGISFSHAGVSAMEGQTLTVRPKQSACYRCVFPAAPAADAVPSTSRVGILGSVAGIVGAIQATECIKCITGAGHLLTDTLLVFDASTMNFRAVSVQRNAGCPACGNA
ncbi:MAG: adenylyltransferase [Chitinivibrionales bacterium]|nr:adenylyltransferase [Chitinivibrionales bacterium]MBD3397181.1 adenylyltransferase [Chitinivibrionales bacterium]